MKRTPPASDTGRTPPASGDTGIADEGDLFLMGHHCEIDGPALVASLPGIKPDSTLEGTSLQFLNRIMTTDQAYNPAENAPYTESFTENVPWPTDAAPHAKRCAAFQFFTLLDVTARGYSRTMVIAFVSASVEDVMPRLFRIHMQLASIREGLCAAAGNRFRGESVAALHALRFAMEHWRVLAPAHDWEQRHSRLVDQEVSGLEAKCSSLAQQFPAEYDEDPLNAFSTRRRSESLPAEATKEFVRSHSSQANTPPQGALSPSPRCVTPPMPAQRSERHQETRSSTIPADATLGSIQIEADDIMIRRGSSILSSMAGSPTGNVKLHAEAVAWVCEVQEKGNRRLAELGVLIPDAFMKAMFVASKLVPVPGVQLPSRGDGGNGSMSSPPAPDESVSPPVLPQGTPMHSALSQTHGADVVDVASLSTTLSLRHLMSLRDLYNQGGFGGGEGGLFPVADAAGMASPDPANPFRDTAAPSLMNVLRTDARLSLHPALRGLRRPHKVLSAVHRIIEGRRGRAPEFHTVLVILYNILIGRKLIVAGQNKRDVMDIVKGLYSIVPIVSPHTTTRCNIMPWCEDDVSAVIGSQARIIGCTSSRFCAGGDAHSLYAFGISVLNLKLEEFRGDPFPDAYETDLSRALDMRRWMSSQKAAQLFPSFLAVTMRRLMLFATVVVDAASHTCDYLEGASPSGPPGSDRDLRAGNSVTSMPTSSRGPPTAQTTPEKAPPAPPKRGGVKPKGNSDKRGTSASPTQQTPRGAFVHRSSSDSLHSMGTSDSGPLPPGIDLLPRPQVITVAKASRDLLSGLTTAAEREVVENLASMVVKSLSEHSPILVGGGDAVDDKSIPRDFHLTVRHGASVILPLFIGK